jgi:ubiquinone/menaquinone biosynthesis C-methylase UbiE
MKIRFLSLVAFLVLVAGLVPGQQGPAPEEESVRPGINQKFLDPDLKVDEYLRRFEVESREIFVERKQIVELCGIRKGMTVADVGAGTGLFTRLFSKAVGPKGHVYAVEISPALLKHIVERARQEKQDNITAVLCPEDSVTLPLESIDFAFICDTYHHFEYPMGTMRSLVKALKKGGNLAVIDFERIEGQSSKWLLGHVRAGKEVFRKEIEDAGLTFVEEIKVDGFKENYFLRFRKN